MATKKEREQIEAYYNWRREQQGKPRVMTAAEYHAWCAAGDGISHPSCSNAMRGGLTIILGGPPVLGQIVDLDLPAPALPFDTDVRSPF